MTKKHTLTIKRKFVNFFGGLGYLVSVFEWVFTIIIYTSVIKVFLTYITPVATKPVVSSPSAVFDIRSSLPVMIIAGIVTVFFIVLSLYVFIKTPSKIVKTTKDVVHHSAETIAPVVMHVQHIPDTQQNHKKAVFNVSLFIKISIIIVPIILCYFSQFTEKHAISFSNTMYACLFLAGVSGLAFTLQYVLARVLSVKRQDIW